MTIATSGGIAHSPSILPAPLDWYLSAWNDAGSVWNCDSLAERFTEDGLFFGGRPEHSVGREAIRAYFRSYIGTISSCNLALRDQHVAGLGPDCLMAQGFGDFSFVLSDGSRTRSVVRTTLVLVSEGNDWKARLQHIAPLPKQPPLGREN